MLNIIIQRKIDQLPTVKLSAIPSKDIVCLMNEHVCIKREDITWLKTYQLLMKGWTPLPF